MNILKVPRIGSGKITDPFRPEIPAVALDAPTDGFLWGQASECFDKEGFCLIHMPTLSERDVDVLSKEPGIEIVKADNAAERIEMAQIIAGFKSPAPTKEGAKWSARDDFMSASRAVAKPIEDEVLAEAAVFDAFDKAKKLVVLIGMAGAAAWFSRVAALPLTLAIAALMSVMPLTVYCSDSFNRGDATLNGSTLNNAGGGSLSVTWLTVVGTQWVTASNIARNNNTGADETINVNLGTDIAEMAATIATQRVDTGVGIRWTAGGIAQGNYAMSYRTSGNAHQLLKRLDAGFTQIGSNGSSLSNGNIYGPVVDSSLGFSATLAGATDIAGGTGTSLGSTGKYMLYNGGSAGNVAEDFVGYYNAGGGVVVPALDGEMLVGGFLEMGGGL